MEHIVNFPKLGIELNINEDVLSIGSFTMKWYGLLIAVGFLLAVFYAYTQIKKMNIDGDKLIDVIIVGLICGIIGARLYYVIFDPVPEGGVNPYFENPMKILYFWEGGLGFYGGFIGAVIGGAVMSKIRKLKVPAVLDIVSIGFLLGQGIGRWGNFFNQEAFGSNTNSLFGMISEETTRYLSAHQSFLASNGIMVDPNMPVHPTFLYESFLCLVGFVVLHFFNSRLRHFDGQTFFLYLIWYGSCRFFIESVRTDSLMIGSLKVSMLMAAVTVVASLIILFLLRKKTTLTGCGSKKIMALNGITAEGVTLSENHIEEKEGKYESILSDDVKAEKADEESEGEHENTTSDDVETEKTGEEKDNETD